MSRIAIPVTALDRIGVAPPSQTDADATRKHTIVNQGSRMFLEIVSSDGSDRTVDFELVAAEVDGVTVPPKTVTIPAGATRWVGPFPAAFYNQAEVAADGTLTSDATAPANNDAVTIDGHVYTFKTTLTEAKASATLTSDGTSPADGDTVTVGTHVYTFKTTLTGAADQVLINGSAANALANLKKAINASGVAGTDYGTGTVAHTTVDAGAITSTTLVLSAKTIGTAGNSYASTETSAHLSFGGATFSGGAEAVANQVLIGANAAAALTNLKAAINAGAGEGSTYSTGTVVHATVAASTLTSTTLQVVAQTAGTDGNTIATTETSAHLSWGGATLAGGLVGGTVIFANPSVATTLKFRAYRIA